MAGPWIVWVRITEGSAGLEAVGAAAGKQGLVAAAQHDAAHLPAVGRLVENHRAFAVRIDQRVGIVRLDQMDFHLAVHAQGELVVGAGIPGRLPLGAHGLHDVFQVFADGDALIGRAPARDVEHVGKNVVFRIVFDGVDAAGRKIVQPAEHGFVFRHDTVLHLTNVRYTNFCSNNEHYQIRAGHVNRSIRCRCGSRRKPLGERDPAP